MARYRLRFLLQEFDLRGPEVVIGRSPECHITIEDPLVSRRHARIVIGDGPPEVIDLGSRNGVRVNGEKIEGSHPLKHSDRVRLGTQELVFYLAEREKRQAKTTGFMTVCHACATPFPEQALSCPHCGAPAREDDTMSGLLVEPRRTFTFQLLGEVIERALSTNRIREAVRLMRRAAREVDERLTGGEDVNSEQLSVIAGYALRLAKQGGDAEWVHWALNVHRQQALFLDASLVGHLEELDLDALPDASEFIHEFCEWASEKRDTLRPPPPAEELDRLARLC